MADNKDYNYDECGADGEPKEEQRELTNPRTETAIDKTEKLDRELYTKEGQLLLCYKYKTLKHLNEANIDLNALDFGIIPQLNAFGGMNFSKCDEIYEWAHLA